MTAALRQLCNPKNTIIAKDKPKVPKFDENENLQLKADFSNPKMRFSIVPQASSSNSQKVQQSSKNEQNEVYMERCYMCDSVIVRIMKTRKVLPTQELIATCIT